MPYFIFIILILHNFMLFQCNNGCSKTICNPRAGDLLIGRESFLRASSTCGLDEFERYCVVTPSDSLRKSKCNVCYSKDPYQRFSSQISHRIENIVSRLPQDSNRWWQSVNGVHNVSIEVNFESEFQFTFTHLRFKTYRPAAMYIERSKDYGRNWDKYAYFSDNCARDFPNIPERKRNNITEVLCTSEFSSIIPSEGGTVLFSADTSDLHTNGQFWNKKRNDITAITNLRVQFVRLHTFGDWKIDDNPNIRNKYYYAVSEWIIRGRCSCYGHASGCKPKEGQIQINEMVYGVCECQHNTKGQHCEKCTDFYNDSPWLPADKKSTNACRKCNCNNHSKSCHFDPAVYILSGKTSGGVCDNCLYNTESKNCERCKSGYYRNSAVPITSNETCLKCQCDIQGTTFSQLCIQENELEINLIAGNCICKENVDGTHCDKCKIGYWKFDGNDDKGCTKCECVMIGTIENQGCDSLNGNCFCKRHVTENDCSTCKNGYYNLSSSNPDGCSSCGCSEHGSVDIQSCDKFSGQCKCKQGYSGRTCNEIKSEWFVEEPRYPLKHLDTIKIELPPVSKSGYYNFIITVDTQQMQINDAYVVALSIGHDKKTSCQSYQDTMTLIKDTKHIVVPNQCLEKDLGISISVFTIEKPNDRFMFPAIVDIVVIPMIDTNTTKTRTALADCLKSKKLTLSKQCEFINAEISSKLIPKQMPKECRCNVTGSVGNVCSSFGGQCHCLPNVVGRNCDMCDQNAYGFDARGCKKCNCVPRGSLNLQCSRDTGKCLCREGVEGQHCDSCKSGYWNFPFCDVCKCNQMSDLCDQKTGRCINCRGNSFGFNCQQCDNGFYGDTSLGIPCLKCSCPGLSNNRNNSIGCSLIFNTTTYMCICKTGYTGRFCDSCDKNYFGNPLNKDGSCSPCKCSGNINKIIPNSCNSRTGECTKCLYNTAGFNCEKCAPGYFGNGVSRTCSKCVCNTLGTNLKNEEKCNHETGKCPCLQNVIGQQCDECRDRFYNITSENGCVACECDHPIGATNKSCNKLTGQCHCHSTRSGLKCDKCEDGFWGDPKRTQGCKVCICNEDGSLFKQCERNNGACRCKSGITGRNCDRCSKGTDGKMPNCTSCGECWLQWDSTIQNIEMIGSNISNGNFMNNTKTVYPKEINIIFANIDRYLESSKSLVKYLPLDYKIMLKRFELKLGEIRTIFENIKVAEFDEKLYSIIEISKLIDMAKKLVAKNKIKDIEGANNEITKSLKLINEAVVESKRLFKNIVSMKGNLSVQNNDLKNIKTESLSQRNKELDELTLAMINSLITFNGMTCTFKPSTNPLKCSEFCDGVGCKPDTCSRNSSINSHCILTNSTKFFNSYAWSIEKRKELEPNLKQMTDYITTLNSRNIKETFLKSEEEYNASAQLIGVTNETLHSKYLNTLKLLNKLRKYLNGSANEEDFKSLVDNISKFELSFSENEILKLEEQISYKKKKLSNVVDILDQSRKNRKICDVLKTAANQAKKDANNLLKSIKNINNNYETNQKYKDLTNDLLFRFKNSLMKIENSLKQITENQNKTEKKQIHIDNTISRTISIESKIQISITASLKTLKNLKDFQSKSLVLLENIEKRMTIAEEKRDKITKGTGVSDGRLSQAYQQLNNKIQVLTEKIRVSRDKLTMAKKSVVEKEKEIENLHREIDKKIFQLASLQDKIYSKSEYHAKCLP